MAKRSTAVAIVEPERNPEEDRARFIDKIKTVVGRLESLANERVGQRTTIERRWIEDLEQYHGRYDPETEKKLNDGDKSKLFINETRPKTNALAARLMDLLFPTDDKNWGIGPTPVPSLTERASAAAKAADAKQREAEAAQEQASAAQEAGAEEAPALQTAATQKQEEADEVSHASKMLRGIIEEAERRSELMEREIDDQLKQSLYHAVMRDVIEMACKLGTGVAKGPVTGDRVRQGWKKQPVKGEDGQPVMGPDGQPATEYALQMSAGDQPAMRFVDLWAFFPDMDVNEVGKGEGNLERHLMNNKQMRKLGQLPGFDKEAIRKLLKQQAKGEVPSYLADLRNLKEASHQSAKSMYHVWEYSGCLDYDDMVTLAMATGDEATLDDLEEVDPLTELNAVVWFCQGEILKFSIYPYDSGECMYSVFCLEKDEASIFGYGLPNIIRDPQKSLNAAWRMMMDNGGISSGPQIVIAKGLVEPADGDWTLRPRKVWWAKDGVPKENRAFDAFNIPMNQEALANIVEMSRQQIDTMSSMPPIAQGEQGAGVTKTAQGMALLMNSTNVVFRRIVKNFDDDMTTPNIRRFYDWNMQFSKKEEIKGDYEVDARGSSVLLVREMQAQNLMMIALQIGAHPIYGPMLKQKAVLRKLFQAHMIPADDIMLSDEEIDAILAAAAAAPQEDPRIEFEREKLAAEVEVENMKAQNAKDIAIINRETQMMKMAEQMNLSLDQIEAKLQAGREAIQSKERIVATETAMAERTGQHAGGYV